MAGFFLRNRVGNNHVEMHYDRDFEENCAYTTSAKKLFKIRNFKNISFGNKREFHGNSSTKNFQDSIFLDDNNNMDYIEALRLNSTQTFQKGKLHDYEYLNMHKIKKNQRNSKKNEQKNQQKYTSNNKKNTKTDYTDMANKTNNIHQKHLRHNNKNFLDIKNSKKDENLISLCSDKIMSNLLTKLSKMKINTNDLNTTTKNCSKYIKEGKKDMRNKKFETNKIKHKYSRKHNTENFMKDNIKYKLIQKDHKMINGLNNTPKMKNARKGKHKKAKTKSAYEYCDVCGDEFKFEIKNDKSPMKNSYIGENTVNGRKTSIRTNSHITNICNTGLNSKCNNKKIEHTHKVQDDKSAMQNSNQYTNLEVDHRNHP